MLIELASGFTPVPMSGFSEGSRDRHPYHRGGSAAAGGPGYQGVATGYHDHRDGAEVIHEEPKVDYGSPPPPSSESNYSKWRDGNDYNPNTWGKHSVPSDLCPELIEKVDICLRKSFYDEALGHASEWVKWTDGKWYFLSKILDTIRERFPDTEQSYIDRLTTGECWVTIGSEEDLSNGRFVGVGRKFVGLKSSITGDGPVISALISLCLPRVFPSPIKFGLVA